MKAYMQDDITKIHVALQRAINEICMIPQSRENSTHIFKAVNHVNNAMLMLPAIRHEIWRNYDPDIGS